MHFKSVVLPFLSLATGVLSGHFYTTDPTGELAPSSGYPLEGIAGYVWSGSRPNIPTIPIYRYYNPSSNTHFYTYIRNDVPPGYNSEGIGFWVLSGAAGNKGVSNDIVPFYQWHLQSNDDYFYTTDRTGELAPGLGYHPEGTIGYVFPPGPNLGPSRTPEGSQPLYRWYLP